MIDLYLHVGLGKTGSTYLQSILDANIKLLKEHSILYPVNSSIQNSGNGHLLYSDNYFDLIDVDDQSYSKVLFSREHFSRELAGMNFSSFFGKLKSAQSIRNIYVLIFVRDAFDHCYSLWSQKIKNTSETRSFREFSKNYDSLSVASTFIAQSIECGLNITVLNYSSSSCIHSSFFQWLDPTFRCSNLYIPNSFVNVSPSFPLLNRNRLTRRFMNFPYKDSFLFTFYIYICSIPFFKPRHSVLYFSIFRSQVSQLNCICFSNATIIKNGFSMVSS